MTDKAADAHRVTGLTPARMIHRKDLQDRDQFYSKLILRWRQTKRSRRHFQDSIRALLGYYQDVVMPPWRDYHRISHCMRGSILSIYVMHLVQPHETITGGFPDVIGTGPGSLSRVYRLSQVLLRIWQDSPNSGP